MYHIILYVYEQINKQNVLYISVINDTQNAIIYNYIYIYIIYIYNNTLNSVYERNILYTLRIFTYINIPNIINIHTYIHTYKHNILFIY